MPAGRRTVSKNDASEVLRQEFNKLRVKYDALLAKLDADAGVTDADFVSTLGTGSSGGAASVTLVGES